MNCIGIIAFLRAIERDEAVYLVGIIPLLAGFALLVHGYIIAPKESRRRAGRPIAERKHLAASRAAFTIRA